MNITTAVKERILALCLEKNITINRLGTICGITQSTLKNITSGRNGITLITLKKICDGLDLSLVEFFSDELFYALEQEIV
ncbi:MAG: helix-turn-helix transcriptional regulator [Oscillospiraceae bacterium]|nr:helix-turn-helix transcriptional regulator [Oscillospiraceae bacterium]